MLKANLLAGKKKGRCQNFGTAEKDIKVHSTVFGGLGCLDPQVPALTHSGPVNGVSRLKPREIAVAVAFLASPLSSYTNGAFLRIDGGMARFV